jgi:O-antigen/teichoic acid export membrane protein
MSRVRFASMNYLSSFLLTALSLAVGFIATPWLLRWLGEETYGAFRVGSDWLGYLTLLEFGVSGALPPLLARAFSKNELQKVPELLAVGIRAYLGITGSMLIAGLVLTGFIPHLVKISPEHVRGLRWGCLIGLVNVFWLPLAAPFRSVVEARQRGYWITLLLTLQSLVVTGSGLLLAWMKFGITGQFVAFALGCSCFNAVMIWYGTRSYPGVFSKVLQPSADKSTAAELWRLNIPTYILNLCGRISLLTDNVVVAGILGPVMIVPLILTQKLTSAAQVQLQGIGNASWAGLAELYERGERDTFERRLIDLTSLTCILGMASLVPIAAFNERFVSLWVGSNRYGGGLMTLFAALNPFLLSLISLWGWVLTGLGQVKRFVRPLVFQTLINFISSILLIKKVGSVGALIGTFTGFVSVTIWYLPLELRRAFGIKTSGLIKAVFPPLGLAIPYGTGLWFLARWHAPRGWLELAGEMLVSAVIYLGLAWYLVLTLADRGAWKGRIPALDVRSARLVFSRIRSAVRPKEPSLAGLDSE